MADVAAAPSAASVPAAGHVRRPWYRSVAGKLLLAFALIGGLTVAGSMLSISRFAGLEAVLLRLIGVSMPAVTTSLDIELKATQVAVSAVQLGNSESSVQLFAQNEKLLAEIQDLWAGLAALRRIVGDTEQTRQLQQVIAGADAMIGELNRAATEKILLTERRERIIDGLAPLVETLASRVSDLRSGSNGAAAAASDTLADLSRQVVTLGAVVTRVATSVKVDQFATLRDRIAFAKIRLAADIAALTDSLPVDQARSAALTGAIDTLLREIEGANGILSVREREIRSAERIARLQDELGKAGEDLRRQVRALVSRAEQDSAASTERSVSEIAKSRFWLALIAALSLLLAGLVVWLFVYRYVIEALSALSHSMLAIARGDLAAPIPAAQADELGDMSHALAVFRDNAREIHSAREEAEAAREEAEAAREEAEAARAEAEAASRTKSAFLANMSHELRTPLNAIIGYSEILVEDATDRGDDASIGDLQKIQSAGKHLLGLINDILDLSKIEAGRMDVYLEQIYLTRLVDEVKTIVEPMVVKNGNTLVLECPPDIGSLRTDLTKLKQSLINLLSNAAKFTKQGKVTLRLSRDSAADGSARVSFAVMDSGIGMTEEQMGRLFQAFTQADSSTTRNFGGTGLGLTITRHFCTMLGGSIDVASKPGEGSSFTIVLPDQAPKHVAATTVVPDDGERNDAHLSPAAMTVLVVDDDPIVHDVLNTTLSREGCRLMHASNGTEAIDMMRKTRPDVVTLDVMMPGMDGWSVLGAIKSDEELADIPVIMLTIVDDRTLGYSLGASEFMTKPIDRAKLVALLRKFSPPPGDGVVLIVDDDADARRLLKTAVEGEGLKTAEAGNGRIALDWLTRNPKPALVLLDIMMPEVDGFEFLERVRERDALAELPIVVLTAKELTDSERGFLAERTILVLSKSAQPIGKLGAALAAIAGRAQAARPAVH